MPSFFSLGPSLFAIGAAAMPVTPPATDDTRGWTCQRDLRGPGDNVLFVRNELSSNGRHLAYIVGFRGSSVTGESTALSWSVPKSRRWYDGLDDARFLFEFPAAPQDGPVFGALFRDGVYLARTVALSMDWAKRLRKEVRVQGDLNFASSAARPIRLYGASVLTAVITAPDGRELGRPRFPLPDWKRADRFVKGAIVQLDRDAADYSSRCGQQGPPMD